MTEPAAYRRIAASVRARISNGELRAGDRAPSTRDLMREHSVASATAARALGLLRDQGLIVTVPRSGSLVADLPPAASSRRPGGLTRSGSAVRSARVDPRNPAVAAATAAVALADAEGLSAVTIRRVAAELGVPTLALSRRCAAGTS
ncbi:MAG: winged helix-turn-helix domain-containing protein [Nakamurella sp.]